MIFKPYPKYTSCAIQWFNQIPQSWKQVRVEQYLIKKDENIGDLWSSTQLLSLTQKGIIEKDINEGKGKTHSDYSTYQAIDIGDLVFCLFDIDETPRTVGLSTKKGMITSAYTAFKSKENINTQYVYYFFESLDDAKALKPYYKGLRKTVRPPEFLKIHVPFPPKVEQVAISQFLDTETTRIDNLITKQEKLIELLEEQRKSIISHAVTKGLNPNAPMKDSGVEWLGKVPEHWQILKLRQLVKLESGSALPLDRINPDGKYPVYGGNNIRGFTENFNMKGDYILVGRQGSLCGNINYASGEFWATEHAVVVYPKKPVSLTFLGELLRTMNLNQYSIASAQAGLSVDRISNIYTIYIPFEEQIQIAKKIDHENLKLDKLIDKQKMLIEKLKEYRSSVISYAVTGKIDVREFGA